MISRRKYACVLTVNHHGSKHRVITAYDWSPRGNRLKHREREAFRVKRSAWDRNQVGRYHHFKDIVISDTPKKCQQIGYVVLFSEGLNRFDVARASK
jgi:hypothetical protein